MICLIALEYPETTTYWRKAIQLKYFPVIIFDYKSLFRRIFWNLSLLDCQNKARDWTFLGSRFQCFYSHGWSSIIPYFVIYGLRNALDLQWNAKNWVLFETFSGKNDRNFCGPSFAKFQIILFLWVSASQTEDSAASEAPKGPNEQRSTRSGERPKTIRFWTEKFPVPKISIIENFDLIFGILSKLGILKKKICPFWPRFGKFWKFQQLFPLNFKNRPNLGQKGQIFFS